MPPSRRLACWLSEKKSQKFNWQGFQETCERYGFELFRMDLTSSFESQEPFCAFLHKLTDIIAASSQGDIKSINTITQIKEYIQRNPSLVVIDPIQNVEILLDRYKSYTTIRSTNLHKSHGVFTPNFCELLSNDIASMKLDLEKAQVTFPIICKPVLGHGSRQAHKMTIIFNEKNLVDCRVPCVAQSFINHNAVLYKIFIVGEKWNFVKRPSLKNYYTCELDTIYFDSSDVSKAGSQSSLSVLDPTDVVIDDVEPDEEVLKIIAKTVRQAFGMDMLGVDVVIENSTGNYAIIDVNACPGYDGFPNFFDSLLQLISQRVNSV